MDISPQVFKVAQSECRHPELAKMSPDKKLFFALEPFFKEW